MANKLMNFDKFLVEGLDEKWLRRKAKEIGKEPDDKLRSLKLVELCLIGLGFEDDHASKIMSPLHEVHDLPLIPKGHTSGQTAMQHARNATAVFGNLREHFRHLCAECDEFIEIVAKAFASRENETDDVPVSAKILVSQTTRSRLPQVMNHNDEGSQRPR